MKKIKMTKKRTKAVFAVLCALVLVLGAMLIGVEVNNSKYNKSKSVMTQTEVEEALFSQPITTEREGEYRISVKTAKNGDFHAELTVYEAEGGKYKKLFSCPAVIGKNGGGKQAEGDGKTPLGTWKIGTAYGIKENPGSLVPYTQISNDMYWCSTSSKGAKYNKLIYKSDDENADYSNDEHLIDYPGVYDYFIDTGFNSDSVPYLGSAIFIHCWRNEDTPTAGCVAVSKENMLKILETVSHNTYVTIY